MQFCSVFNVAAAHTDLSRPTPEPWRELARTCDTVQMLKCSSPETPL